MAAIAGWTDEATMPAEVLLIEPLGTTNTGDAGGDLTAEERRI